LTGKYDQGAVPGTRAELPGMEWLREELLGESARPKIEKVKKLKAVADRLGCTRAQLAIAWCLKNPHVSSAITGATRREQVNENLGAMAVAERLNGEVMRDIDRILEGR
jgi:aryl-alcohol dehydrogenase-like predicted oxidoreductase